VGKTFKSVILDNPPARLTLQPPKGRFDLTHINGRSPGLTGATFAVTFAGDPERTLTAVHCKLEASERGEDFVKARYEAGGLALELRIEKAARPGAFLINFAFHNGSAAHAGIRALMPVMGDGETRLETGLKPPGVRVWRNGWYSRDVSRAMRLTQAHAEPTGDEAFPPAGESAEVAGLIRSSWMTQIRCRGGYLTCGFLSQARQFGVISTAARDEGRIAFSAAALADGKPIAPGRTYAAEGLYISIGADFATALSDYASAVGERCRARRSGETPCVWRSGGMDETRCLANLRRLEARKHELPVGVFLVDGWQKAPGDPLPDKSKFPRGMKALADDIRKAGLTPGISCAPFMVDERSETAEKRPELLVAGAGGAPLVVARRGKHRFHALDLTNPESLSHVAQMTSLIRRDWGYAYLAAGDLYLGGVAGARRDPTKTAAQNIRRGLEVIRQVAGEDAYIAAGDCPFGPAVGVVDGMAVGGDVRDGASALACGWMNGLLWDNHVGDLPAAGLSESQGETAAHVAMLSGAALTLSGDLRRLSAADIDALERLFPLPTTAAVPLDLYRRKRPSVYFAAGEPPLLGVFNWGESAATFKLNPRRITAGLPVKRMREFRRGALRAIPRGSITVTLRPRESRLFLFE